MDPRNRLLIPDCKDQATALASHRKADARRRGASVEPPSSRSEPAPAASRVATLFMTFVTLASMAFVRPASGAPIAPAIPQAARPLPLSAVRLTGGPLKNAQDLDARYLLALEPDRMMAGYRLRAGLEPKAKGYGGWDSVNGKQLTGHIGGHYLSGVSLMYAATGDPKFKERADYLVGELKAVQEKQGDGYIGAQADRDGT